LELQSLAGEAAAVDRADAAASAPQPEPQFITAPEAKEAAEAEAGALLDMLAWGIETLFPMLGYSPETKKEGAKKLAPLLLKYNINGTLFARWGAEIEAGMFFGGVAVKSYQTVKAARNAPLEVKADAA
jgi:hypothetical protein